jgi:cell wall-associated NlpC family hydrolase
VTETRQPGDFAAVDTGGDVGALIKIGEGLNGEGFGEYAHALIYIGGGQIVEAQPGGARKRVRGVQPGDLWSTGLIPLTGSQRTAIVRAAAGYVGTPYSFLDYWALAAHHFRLPAPGLRGFIQSSHHMICSQLVDQCYQDGGVRLFDDGRWPGYVTPKSLANLLLARQPKM